MIGSVGLMTAMLWNTPPWKPPWFSYVTYVLLTREVVTLTPIRSRLFRSEWVALSRP